MLKGFKVLDTGDTTLNKVQRNISNVVDPIVKINILDGVLVQNISLDSSKDNVIDPKLGREVQGWIVTRKRSAADIYDKQDTSSSTKTLTLSTSSNVEIDLWIF